MLFTFLNYHGNAADPMVIIASQTQNANAKAQILHPTLPPEPVIVQRMGQVSTSNSSFFLFSACSLLSQITHDEPPPYVARLSLEPSSTSTSTSTSSSQHQQPANLQLLPPSPRRAASSPALRLPIVPPLLRSTPIKREIVATNYLFLQTRKEPIQGTKNTKPLFFQIIDFNVATDTFHIDPDLPMVELDKTGKLSINRQLYNKEHKQKHRHHTKKNKNLKNRVPNAIFQSKSGGLSLNLALVAPPLAAASNALIQASSKKGNIDIKIVS